MAAAESQIKLIQPITLRCTKEGLEAFFIKFPALLPTQALKTIFEDAIATGATSSKHPATRDAFRQIYDLLVACHVDQQADDCG